MESCRRLYRSCCAFLSQRDETSYDRFRFVLVPFGDTSNEIQNERQSRLVRAVQRNTVAQQQLVQQDLRHSDLQILHENQDPMLQHIEALLTGCGVFATDDQLDEEDLSLRESWDNRTFFWPQAVRFLFDGSLDSELLYQAYLPQFWELPLEVRHAACMTPACCAPISAEILAKARPMRLDEPLRITAEVTVVGVTFFPNPIDFNSELSDSRSFLSGAWKRAADENLLRGYPEESLKRLGELWGSKVDDGGTGEEQLVEEASAEQGSDARVICLAAAHLNSIRPPVLATIHEDSTMDGKQAHMDPGWCDTQTPIARDPNSFELQRTSSDLSTSSTISQESDASGNRSCISSEATSNFRLHDEAVREVEEIKQILDLGLGCVSGNREQSGDAASPDDSASEFNLEENCIERVQNLPKLEVADSPKAIVHRADSEDFGSPTAHLRAPGVLLGRISRTNSAESLTSNDAMCSPCGGSVKHSLSPAINETQAALMSPASGVASPSKLSAQLSAAGHSAAVTSAQPVPSCQDLDLVTEHDSSERSHFSGSRQPSASIGLAPVHELDLDAQLLSLGDIMAPDPSPARARNLPRYTTVVETVQVQSSKAAVTETEVTCPVPENGRSNQNITALEIDTGHPDEVAMEPMGGTPHNVRQSTSRRMKSFSTKPQAWITPSHATPATKSFSDCTDFVSSPLRHGLRRANSRSNDPAPAFQGQPSMLFIRLHSDLSDACGWETSSIKSESPLHSKGQPCVVQPSLAHTIITGRSDRGPESLSSLRTETDPGLPNTISDHM